MYKHKAKAVCKDKNEIRFAYKYHYTKKSGGAVFYSRLDCLKYWAESFLKCMAYVAVSPLILLLGFIVLALYVPFTISLLALEALNKYEWFIRFIKDIFYISKKSNRGKISVYRGEVK